MTDTGTRTRPPRTPAGGGSFLQQLLDAATDRDPTAPVPTPGPAAALEQVPARPPVPPVRPMVDGASAAVVTAAAATGSHRPGTRVADVGADTAACLAACADTAPNPGSVQPADWTRFGTVVPVLGASPGAGASVLAVVLADALAAQGLRVLLVDAADPLRSGLALAASSDARATPGPHPGVCIRHGHRGPIAVARLEFAGLPVRSPGMVPAPVFFDPTSRDGDPVEVTVVDVGWDAWTVAGLPLHGPGGWLRTGPVPPRPVLAVRATAPGVRAAETLLARLAPWHGHGVSPVAATVLTSCRKPSPAALAAAGHHLEPLLRAPVCLPTDPALTERGVTDTETPTRLQRSLTPVLSGLGLLRPTTALTSRSVAARLLRRPPQHQEGNPS